MIETTKSRLKESDIRLHAGSRINYLYKPNWIQGRFCYCCFYPLYFNISMYSFFSRISLCFCNMTHFQSSYRLHNILLAWYNFTRSTTVLTAVLMFCWQCSLSLPVQLHDVSTAATTFYLCLNAHTGE